MQFGRFLLSTAITILLVGWSTPARAVGKPLPPLKPGEHIESFFGVGYLIAHGWTMPYPPYPEKARWAHEQGRVYLHLETDKTGQVVKTSVLHTPLNTSSKTLRQTVVLWTLYKWHGPPNASTNVEFDFRLQHAFYRGSY